ncbi:Bax inhibitor-1/YccA family protein [Streptomyces sp. NPDC046716]|uniref:Bax inhibitor-1/YccA family protein n=1 Tax=Streptomyces sp. NPDC046716 TaxID=3157093 RepID=UPI0034118831
MKSSNPVFTRWGAGRDRGPDSVEPVADRSTNPYAGTGVALADKDTATSAMTVDDVVVRTGTTLGTVVLGAVLSWLLLPVDEAAVGRSYAIAVGAALIAFVLSMIQTLRRTPSPALILGYAAFEGVFLGVLSSVTSTYIAPGVVVQAVLGTFAVAAGMLIAYRMRWIRVTRRFTGIVVSAATGFVLLLLADSLFSAFGAGNGLGFHSGGLGVVFGVAGILLGACFLALDFRQVEDAVAFGAPRDEAWFAAFGLTMTLVWIYLEVLQVLTVFNSDN